MAFELRVNGKTYSHFKQVDGVSSRDNFAREIKIVTSQQPNNNSFMKMGDLVETLLDGVQNFTGYVEKINDSLDPGSHDVSFGARSTVSDLIDSFLPANVKVLESVPSFAELVKLCIAGIGLTDSMSVIDNVGATFGSQTKLIAGETGQKIGDYLQENARVVQVFLNTDGLGNAVINKNYGQLKTALQNIPGERSNNVKSANMQIDNSQRYNKYIVYSNSSLATDGAAAEDLNHSGSAIDDEIRKSRVFEKFADNPMAEDQCKKSAEEEANIRRARSFNYDCEVVGFSANSELWEGGYLVTVKDPDKGMNGKFLINSVTWSSSDNGEISKLSITLPDKNTGLADPTAVTKRTTSVSSTYGVQAGDTLSQLAIDNNITLDQLIQANPKIINPDFIRTGQEINIPSGGA